MAKLRNLIAIYRSHFALSPKEEALVINDYVAEILHVFICSFRQNDSGWVRGQKSVKIEIYYVMCERALLQNYHSDESQLL